MQSKTASPDDATQAEKIALGLLTRREHSRYELQTKLRQRGFVREVIGVVLDRLAEQGWQSDVRYAESYVRMRIARGYGEAAIQAELRQRGVDSPLAHQTLCDADVDWLECAQQQIRRHFNFPPEDAAEKLRRYRHLCNRGFTPEQARIASARWPEISGTTWI
ncbi:regulatory protein RecX [Halothiobacillus sp.]|jgi:regulatory protein|uniref:regulatory protein RecX n=1 Tax=Halothiobacillus sp. TaxID=1891311 RepID=UPI002AD22088|nr:regulatory protein RecX [Halothiobacillus sp.]